MKERKKNWKNLSLMRFTSLALAFLLALQALEEHLLVYAHQGGDADQRSLTDYRQDKPTLWYKEFGDDIVGGELKKLRFRGRKIAASRAKKRNKEEINNQNGLKISGATESLIAKRKLGFRRSNTSSKNSDQFVAFHDDYHGPARHPPRHN